jgi:hypothetical protein
VLIESLFKPTPVPNLLHKIRKPSGSLQEQKVKEHSLAIASLVIPSFMHTALTESLFWLGLGIMLPVGYAVAYPVVYWALKRGHEQRTAGAQTAHHQYIFQ